MGRTWDEYTYVRLGYSVVQKILNNTYISSLQKHTPLEDTFGFDLPDPPPLARYLFGLVAPLDFKGYSLNKEPVFNYDLTFPRLVSVFFACLSAVLTLFLGWEYLSPFAGITSGVIFSMLPFFLGLSQLAVLESTIVFFFTGSIYAFIKFIEKRSNARLIATGFLLGCAFLTKFTNVLLVPLFVWIYLIWYFSNNRRDKFFAFMKKLFMIFLIASAVFAAFWPLLWFRLQQVLEFGYAFRVVQNRLPVPEIFFGRLMLVPVVYFLIHFVLTTPLGILLLFSIGLLVISSKTNPSQVPKLISFRSTDFLRNTTPFLLLKAKDKKNWILLALVVWFILPFVQSFYNFRQHGVRYIVQIYVPLCLVSALGLEYLIEKVSKKKIAKILGILIIGLYLFAVLWRITPYYLDYFNFIAGGAKGVAEKRLFQLGWWGQGAREAGIYLQRNAHYGSKIGLATVPLSVFPPISGLKISEYKQNEDYDYIVVSYHHITRDRFNDSQIRLKYKPVYVVRADGAPLMTVYKK